MDSGFCSMSLSLLVHSKNFHERSLCRDIGTDLGISVADQCSAVSAWDFVFLGEVIPQTSSPWLSGFCWSRALRQCLWSCVLWSVWSLARPRGLVKSLTTGLLSHTALPPQYQNSHICRAAACRSSRFMSWTRRDTRKTGGPALDLFSGSKQLFSVLW